MILVTDPAGPRKVSCLSWTISILQTTSLLIRISICNRVPSLRRFFIVMVCAADNECVLRYAKCDVDHPEGTIRSNDIGRYE